MRRRVRVKTSFLDDIAFTAAVADKKAEQLNAAFADKQAANMKCEKLKADLRNLAEQRNVDKMKTDKLKADLRHHSVSIRRAHD